MTVIHETYLPYSAEELRPHFAEVSGGGDPDRHTRYYLASRAAADLLTEDAAGLDARARRQRETHGYQMEKDERFWVVTTLMGLYRAEDRVRVFADVFARGLPDGPPDGASWEELLGAPEDLELYFEVNLPAPRSYREWLRTHSDEVVLMPSMRAAVAERRRVRMEGSTKVDAMLVSRSTGFAAAFEAKVLSDISGHTTYDPRRNQLKRNIDVLLDPNPRLTQPLSARDPERSFLFLLTPEQFRQDPESRLYGGLLRGYRTQPELLHRHLPHRELRQLEEAGRRLGWLTWEDCAAILPSACPWLTRPGATPQA